MIRGYTAHIYKEHPLWESTENTARSSNYRQTGELPPQGQTQPKADELRQLRKENAQLRMENDILKKAAAYFAKESL